MNFPQGNQLWKLRELKGNPVKYTPEELLKKAAEYFDWLNENPIISTKGAHYQGEPMELETTKPRAPTTGGFCSFATMSLQTYLNYRSAEGYEAYFDIVAQIDNAIISCKIEGAAADVFNSNIIAREVGLADKSVSEVKQVSVMAISDDPMEAQRSYLEMMEGG